MKTIEIPQAQWQQFCDRIQKFAAGAMVRIEDFLPDGATEIIADTVPLRRLILDDKGDACSNHLILETGQPGESPARHVVIEPIRIILRNDRPEDRYHKMEVSAESGTTIVTFHPGLTAATLPGAVC